MKLFTLNESYEVIFEPQAILLAPFKKIVDRDKGKKKIKAINELAFVWFFADIKSEYQFHTDEEERTKHLIADMPGLPKGWKADKLVQDAIDFYNESSVSVTATILKDSMYIANKISSKMRSAVDAEDDLDITEISRLLDSVKKMPDIIKALQAAEQAVLKEVEEAQDKLGSKEKALFEDGI